MATDFNDGFEVEVISINDKVGYYGGDLAPWNEAVDAPVGSLYLRTNGNVYKKITVGNSSVNWTALEAAAAAIVGCVPFWLFDTNRYDIPLDSGQLPFWHANGTRNDIPAGACGP